MKESLIKFETAVLAKEVGFDWSVYWYYGKHKLDGKEYLTPIFTDLTKEEVEVCIDDLKPEDMNNSDTVYWVDKNYRYYSAIEQSLLQKWLREVHHIDVYIMPNFYNASPKLGYIYSIDCFDKNNVHDGKTWDADQIEILGDSKGFDTYDEALENGLFKGLNIIKDGISKNKMGSCRNS